VTERAAVVRIRAAASVEEPRSVPARLPEDATIADLCGIAIAGSAIRLPTADARVRVGRDPDAVHDARVAVRRIRSTLRAFSPVLDPEWTAAIRAELRWVGKALGELRDADVLTLRLERRLEEVGAPEDAYGALLTELHDRRATARTRLTRALASERYRLLTRGLVEASHRPPGRDGRADRPARRAPELMVRPWKVLVRSAKAAKDDPTDELLHETRIRAKRVRYAAESMSLVSGKPSVAFARAAKRLQDVLGEHQDAVTTLRWLSDGPRRSETPDVAFVAGRLAQVELDARRRARSEWRGVWRMLRRKDRFWE